MKIKCYNCIPVYFLAFGCGILKPSTPPPTTLQTLPKNITYASCPNITYNKETKIAKIEEITDEYDLNTVEDVVRFIDAYLGRHKREKSLISFFHGNNIELSMPFIIKNLQEFTEEGSPTKITHVRYPIFHAIYNCNESVIKFLLKFDAVKDINRIYNFNSSYTCNCDRDKRPGDSCTIIVFAITRLRVEISDLKYDLENNPTEYQKKTAQIKERFTTEIFNTDTLRRLNFDINKPCITTQTTSHLEHIVSQMSDSPEIIKFFLDNFKPIKVTVIDSLDRHHSYKSYVVQNLLLQYLYNDSKNFFISLIDDNDIEIKSKTYILERLVETEYRTQELITQAIKHVLQSQAIIDKTIKLKLLYALHNSRKQQNEIEQNLGKIFNELTDITKLNPIPETFIMLYFCITSESSNPKSTLHIPGLYEYLLNNISQVYLEKTFRMPISYLKSTTKIVIMWQEFFTKMVNRPNLTSYQKKMLRSFALTVIHEKKRNAIPVLKIITSMLFSKFANFASKAKNNIMGYFGQLAHFIRRKELE